MKSKTLFAIISIPIFSLVQCMPLPNASSFLVRGLEAIEPAYGLFDGSMYSGLLPMDNGNRHGELMFWLFASESPTVPNTLTIWLNGAFLCECRDAICIEVR
jgi:hypothetical protein